MLVGATNGLPERVKESQSDSKRKRPNLVKDSELWTFQWLMHADDVILVAEDEHVGYGGE